LQNENDIGTIIPKAMGRLDYEITQQAVNKYVSFRYTPIRDDGTVGETRTAMGSERIVAGTPNLHHQVWKFVLFPDEQCCIRVNLLCFDGQVDFLLATSLALNPFSGARSTQGNYDTN
jgi:hypothetical protein